MTDQESDNVEQRVRAAVLVEQGIRRYTAAERELVDAIDSAQSPQMREALLAFAHAHREFTRALRAEARAYNCEPVELPKPHAVRVSQRRDVQGGTGLPDEVLDRAMRFLKKFPDRQGLLAITAVLMAKGILEE